MNEPHRFLLNRVKNALVDGFTMPTGTNNHEFQTRADQMRYWLSDPILHSEAVQWFENAGYYPVLDESGYAYDYTLAPDPERQTEARRSRYAS
jgi:hypothetical protein